MLVLINFHYHLLAEQIAEPLCPSSFPQGGAFAICITAWVLRGLCVHRRRCDLLPQCGVMSVEELWFTSPCMFAMWPRVFVDEIG